MTSENLPPIAVLITAFDRQSKLERALKSLEPELSLLDIIIVDDGSTPPVDITQFSHYPITLIRLPTNRGAMAASNAGLDHIYTKGYEFLARLDSDDEAINQRFRKQLTFLRNHPDIGLVGTHFDVVNPEGKMLIQSQPPCEDQKIRNGLHVGNMLHHSTWMVRTRVAQKAGFYNTDFIAGGDSDFCWRLLEVTRVANIPEALIRYEVGAKSSLSSSKRYIQARNTLRLKLQHFDVRNPYAYIGIVVSILDIANVLQYVLLFRQPVTRLLFGKTTDVSYHAR